MRVRTLPAVDANGAATRTPYARWCCRVNLRASPEPSPSADYPAAAGMGTASSRRTPPLAPGSPEFQFSRHFTTVYDDPQHLKLAIQAAQAVLLNPASVPLSRASGFAPELVKLVAPPAEVTAAVTAEMTAAEAAAAQSEQPYGAGPRETAPAVLPTAALAQALSAAVAAALDPAKAKATAAAAAAAGTRPPAGLQVKPHHVADFLLQHRQRRRGHNHQQPNHPNHHFNHQQLDNHHQHARSQPQPAPAVHAPEASPAPPSPPPPPPPLEVEAAQQVWEARHCDALLLRLGLFPDVYEATASRGAVVLEVDVLAGGDGAVPKMDVLEIITAAAEPGDPRAEAPDASAPPHRITLLAPAATATSIAVNGMGIAATTAAAASGAASPPPAAAAEQAGKPRTRPDMHKPLLRCCGHVEVLLLDLLRAATRRLAEELLTASSPGSSTGGTNTTKTSSSTATTTSTTDASPAAASLPSPLSVPPMPVPAVVPPSPSASGSDLRRRIAAAARELRAAQADCLPCFVVGDQDVGALPELEAAAGLGRKNVRRMSLQEVQILLARHHSHYGSSSSSTDSSSGSSSGLARGGCGGGGGDTVPYHALQQALNECFNEALWCAGLAAHAEQVAGAVREAAGRAVAAVVDGRRYPETQRLLSACLAAHVDELAGAVLRRRLYELLRVERIMVYTRGGGGAFRRERASFMGRLVAALQGPDDDQPVDEEALMLMATCLAYFKVLHAGVQAAVPRALAAHLLQPLAQPAKLQPLLWQRALAADDITWHQVVSKELLLTHAAAGGGHGTATVAAAAAAAGAAAADAPSKRR